MPYLFLDLPKPLFSFIAFCQYPYDGKTAFSLYNLADCPLIQAKGDLLQIWIHLALEPPSNAPVGLP